MWQIWIIIIIIFIVKPNIYFSHFDFFKINIIFLVLFWVLCKLINVLYICTTSGQSNRIFVFISDEHKVGNKKIKNKYGVKP